MRVHEFAAENKPVMVLIHGLLTPWQIWQPQIEAFCQDYHIFVIALSGHTEESPSAFISLETEVEKILEYLKARNVNAVDVLCGISLGGKIAYEVWKSGAVRIGSLVLDGAPLAACPKFAVNIMSGNYKKIVRNSQARDKTTLENFKKYFLPEKYLESYLRFTDTLTDASVENMVHAAFAAGKTRQADSQCRILFIHGTKGNEILSKKSAKQLKKQYPQTRIHCFKGDAHCYKAIYQPDQWIAVVREFLNFAENS